MAIGRGSDSAFLTDADVRAVVDEALATVDLAGRRVLLIVPDLTRTAPIPLFFRLLHERLAPVVKKLDVLVALGTHMPLDGEQFRRLLGITREERETVFRDVALLNHHWENPAALVQIGTIEADEIERLSGGLMREPLPVRINKLVFDYDQLLVVGPVFPHEVIGFSGGNKYFFPGISGPDVIHQTHWLGALVTNYVINGTKKTPVRDVVNRAAAMIKTPRLCFSLVTVHDGLHGVYFGAPEEAWEAAAALSNRVHIRYKPQPFQSVLSMSPRMYDDLWVAAKCMYKLEPVVADGGELIIYAPHIDEVSYTHGKLIDQVGYHIRDYFVKQWDKFKDVPRAILAHATHVRGIGTFENGIETPRVRVTLASRIPEARCRRVNLGYRDPATINPKDWAAREDEGLLLVKNAGEILYRLQKR
jgi:nickel-dependent lactate racemase